MKAAITSLLLAAVVVLSEARVGPLRHLSKGECPSITNKQDFSIPPYLGTWYEIERLEAGFEEGMDCVRKEYDDSIVEGVVEMRFKGRNADGNFVELVGLATMSEPGVFLVEFPDGNLGAYHVLDTDYKTFAALYNCAQIGDLRYETAWTLSRNTTIDKTILDRAHQAFGRNHVDFTLFQATYQGEECGY